MSITIVTGTPGAGKTLYAVSNLIPHFSSQEVSLHEDMPSMKVKRRVLVDGIKNLVIDHELMTVSKTDPMTDKCICDGEGAANWWEWCKPGDVIVIDEVQRVWRPRGNGSKVPQMIAELETHRHRGVDFVLITQHPMLIDQNVRRLCDRHIHIRRMWGGNRAVRYEWDHCSSPEKVSDAGKSYWPYPKDAFKFYKSAELHTKQGGKTPAALAILAFAAIALPVVGWFATTKVQAMLNPAAPALAMVKPAPIVTSTTTITTNKADAPGGSVAPLGASAYLGTKTENIAKIQGCIASVSRCSCFDVDGLKVKTTEEVCREASYTIGQFVPLIQSSQGPAIAAIAPPESKSSAPAGATFSLPVAALPKKELLQNAQFVYR